MFLNSLFDPFAVDLTTNEDFAQFMPFDATVTLRSLDYQMKDPSKIDRQMVNWLSGMRERLTVHYLESSPYVHCKADGWFQNGGFILFSSQKRGSRRFG